MSHLIADFLNLLYPNLCIICGENLMKHENQICLACLNSMPRTNYHLIKDNPVEKRFWGKVPVFKATSYFFFTKGSPYQKLLHELKYKGNKEVGTVIAQHAASELLENNFFSGIDFIIPVPLHPKKYIARGYNQSECIGLGLSKILGKPQFTQLLIRVKENTTQTKKSVYDRYVNTAGIFELTDKDALAGKHILIVDDVLTTGSTLEAAIQTLQEADNVTISVFTLAMA